MFDLAFPGGLFRLFNLGSIGSDRLVLVMQVELSRFITQATWASGPLGSRSKRSWYSQCPHFPLAGVFALIQSGENIVVSNVGC